MAVGFACPYPSRRRRFFRHFPICSNIQGIDRITGLALTRGLYTLALTVLFAPSVPAAPAPMAPEAIVENYWNIARSQERSLNGASMEVDIEASLPKLKKQGRLHALRRISDIGRITYEHLRFEGDGAIKNDVIARYLTAENQAQS